MLASPTHWKDYYHGSEASQRLARAFSYSDRARYYWAHPDLKDAGDRLLANLERAAAPSHAAQSVPARRVRGRA